jgi:hypothetical protein
MRSGLTLEFTWHKLKLSDVLCLSFLELSKPDLVIIREDSIG